MAFGTHTTARKTRLVEIIRQYDIRTNPAPEALFTFSISTLGIWCVPSDHPGGLWDQVPWRASTAIRLTKPAAKPLTTSMLIYSEAAQDISGFTLQTQALALMSTGLLPRDAIENRPEDVAWATRKLVWLWGQAFPDEPPPHIELTWDRDTPKEDYSDIY